MPFKSKDLKPNTKCHACGSPLYKSPSRIAHFSKFFCDGDCQNSNRVRWIGYLVSNYKNKSVAEMAKHIGLQPSGLRTWIANINKWTAGYVRIEFPKGRAATTAAEKAKRLKAKEAYALKKKKAKEALRVSKIKITPNKALPPANKKIPEALGSIHKLKRNEGIYIAEHNREVDRVIRSNSRTLIIKHKKAS